MLRFADFTITLSKTVPDLAGSVTYTAQAGANVTEGEDFEPTSGTITFPVGSNDPFVVRVPIRKNVPGRGKPAGQLFVALSNASNLIIDSDRAIGAFTIPADTAS